MKWFSLCLLLVAIALSVVQLVEPLLLSKYVPRETVEPPPLPDSLARVTTLDELPSPPVLIPALPANLPASSPENSPQNSPAQPPPAQSAPTAGTVEVQTRELKPVVFAAENLDPDQPLPEPVAVKPQEPPAPAVTCYRYGPLQDFNQVAAAGDLLIKQSMTSDWAEIELPYAEPRYWVVLDEANTPQQAREWVTKLDEKKFADHYLPLAAEEPHLISLGIFKTAERADRHLASLRAAGFPVKMRPRSVELSSRWLQFEAAVDSTQGLSTALAALGLDGAGIEHCAAAPED